MPVTFRLRDLPPGLELRLREAADNAIEGNWCVTVSQSHLDGQWYVQVDGVGHRCRAVLSSTTASVRQLEAMLRRLSGVGPAAALLRHPDPDSPIRQAS